MPLFNVSENVLKASCQNHIEASQLTCLLNQSAGFCVMETQIIEALQIDAKMFWFQPNSIDNFTRM